MATSDQPKLIDHEPPADTFLEDVIAGLSAKPRTLPSKYFYDARGSHLFDEITELDEYYLTDTEIGILKQYGPEIAAIIGPGAMVVEYGSGSSIKTRILLDHLVEPAAYVPVDISRSHLSEAALGLAREFPGVAVMPVCADYTQDFALPQPDVAVGQRIVFFPGSTIGNFTRTGAENFLRQASREADALLIGVDMPKDEQVLHRAYDDSQGVTAAFNLNLLTRMKDELGADIDISAFAHRAHFNADESRIEMHLVARRPTSIVVNGNTFEFEEGESIRTEYSHKYTLDSFAALASRAGLTVREVWMDDRGYFSVQYLERTD